MRCFISIELPVNLVNKVIGFNKDLRESDNLVGNFVKSDNIHLTLKFLGDVSEQKVSEVKNVLEHIECKSFKISLKSLGAFPNENYIKVLWIGVDKGSEDVIKLQKEFDEKLSKIGFKKERDFVPHLTIGRIKFVRDKSKLKSLFDQNRKKEFVSFQCNKICLMKSELTPDGPIYQELDLLHQDS